MKQRLTLRRLLALTAFWASMGFAQIIPMKQLLVQNDKLVGIVYTPARAAGQNTYSEHWVLFPTYVYPGARSQAKLKMIPARDGVPATEADFFRVAPFGTGYRYIHVVGYDTNTLPTR